MAPCHHKILKWLLIEKWLFIICSYVFIYVHYNLMVLVMDAFYFISYSSNELLKIMSSVMIFSLTHKKDYSVL